MRRTGTHVVWITVIILGILLPVPRADAQVGACCVETECVGVITQASCESHGGEYQGDGTACTGDACGFSIGPDVTYTNIQSIMNYGAIGGIYGYALGSHTCNIGDENLLWGTQHNGTPVLAMNAYRLHDGRLEPIGMSWVKHACCAAAGSGCGLPCNGQGGSVLGVGCRDVYSAGWNGGQNRLGPRSAINAYTGEIPPEPGGTGNAIFKRLQIREADMTQPGALYFVEGVYVGSDDAPAGNAMNNASYRRVTIGGAFDLLIADTTQITVPAIFAWQDHGNGPNNPDPDVQIVEADVPGEGRFYVASKAADLGNDTWRYTYAVYNLNSHRSAGSLSVPLPAGADVNNAGFRDVSYHSGEAYDNTDWTETLAPDSMTWSSPQTHEQNPDSNALRWATMYTFWCDVNHPPQPGEVTIGLFRPGTPESITASASVPGLPLGCPADLDGDGAVGSDDLATLLGSWGPNPGHPADLDGDGAVNSADLSLLLGAWGACL